MKNPPLRFLSVLLAAACLALPACSTTGGPSPGSTAAFAQVAATGLATAVIAKGKSVPDKAAKAVEVTAIADALGALADGSADSASVTALVLAKAPRAEDGSMLPHWITLASAAGLLYDDFAGQLPKADIVKAIASGLKAGASFYL